MKPWLSLALGSYLFGTSLLLPVLAGPNEDLIQAIEDKNLAAVQKAVQQKADLNAVYTDEPSVLERAVSSGELSIVKWLLEHGAKFPTTPEAIESIRFSALLSRNLALMQYLFAKGLDPKPKDESNGYVLRGAIYEDRLDLLDYFLKLGFNPNFVMIDDSEEFYQAKYGQEGLKRPLLAHAIDTGKLKTVQLLVRYKAELNFPAADGNSPLSYAIINEQPALAAYLLSLRPRLDLQNQFGETALQLALAHNQPALASSLLAAGAAPLIENHAQESGLDMALKQVALTRKPELLNLILAKIPAAAKSQALSASLVKAAGRGELDSVQFLLKQGASPGFKLADGRTALMTAARSGKPELVKLFLDKGLKPAETDASGQDSLFYAVAGGQLPVLKQLQVAGGRLTGVSSEGLTLLMQAARFKQPEVARYLHELGASLEAVDMNGRTALLWAAEPLMSDTTSSEPQVALIKFLLEQKADPRVRDSQGQTALHLAISPWLDSGACLVQNQIVQLFQTAVIDPDAQDQAGRSPLMLLALTSDSEEMLKTWLSRKANPNLQDKKGNTALHYLTMVSCPGEPGYGPMSYSAFEPTEYWTKVNLLLQHGADPRLKNRQGQSPLELDTALLTPPEEYQ